MAIDTGCTRKHIVTLNTPLANKRPATPGTSIVGVGGTLPAATEGTIVGLPLPPAACLALKAPVPTPLFSVGQACNADCSADFTKDKAVIT